MEKEKFQALKKRFFNFKNLNKLLLVFFIILGAYYIALANNLSVKGFALSDLKQERNKLSDANNKLELKAMALSSYGNISQRISGLKMVAVGNIDYINGASGLVAKK
ncbi:MAG: hypothetical protein Q7R92_03370 [bacterium]|nr:hypothetical protein [bacterium]